MRAYRRVNPAGSAQLFGAYNLFIQGLAHAVQALKLIIAHAEIFACQMDNSGQRLGIVSRKLREDVLPCIQQFARAGDIADVGMDLPGENRIVRQPVDLGPLDLAIPIGPFDQAHHDPVTRSPREIDYPINDRAASLAIGLHHKA